MFFLPLASDFIKRRITLWFEYDPDNKVRTDTVPYQHSIKSDYKVATFGMLQTTLYTTVSLNDVLRYIYFRQ